MPTPATVAFRRYLVVTAVATPANVGVVALGLAATRWHPLVCNLVAATAITVPTYLLCRVWVWSVEPRPGRALAFWASSLIQLLVSSFAVWMIARRDAPDRLVGVTPTATYTVLWFARYAVLDRVVFRRDPSPPGPGGEAPATA